VKPFALSIALVICSVAGGCVGYPRLLSFPFDRGGRSLNSPYSELEPRLSGRYLVLISERNGSRDVYLFDAIDRRLLPLPGLNSLDTIASRPSISEDGRYLVFAGSRQGRTAIYLYDRQTQQKRTIGEELGAEVRNPTISGDGEKIAFEVGKNGQWDIVVSDRAGQILMNINQ
jgi:Tol biopolymer transport system component